MNKKVLFWGCMGIVDLAMTILWGIKGDTGWMIYSLVYVLLCVGGVVSTYKD
jgi:hypothetical protein